MEDKIGCVKQKWYRNNFFPLLPILDYYKPSDSTTRGFNFKWLFFTFWSLDSFGFELAIVADTHWGIGVIGILPFFRFSITIPCHFLVRKFVYRNLDRKCLYEKQENNKDFYT